MSFSKISPDYNNLFPNPLKSDCKNSNLKGAIKSVSLAQEVIKDSSCFDELECRIRQYNVYGNLIRFKLIYDGDKIHSQTDYSYDEKRNLTSMISIDESGNIDEIVDFTSNNHGQVIKQYNQYMDRLYLATYDDDGYLTSVEYKSELDRIKERRYDLLRDSKNPENLL